MDPLISIITPFFNSARFLEEAIASVHQQTYNNWELLLVDDGSIDISSEIARDHQRRHPDRIFCLTHPNRKNHGLVQSLNLGLERCRGEFVAFLHSDDVWLPFKLARQAELLQRQPTAGLLFGRSDYWYDWSDKPFSGIKNSPGKWVPGDYLYNPPLLAGLLYPLGEFSAPCVSNLLLRRSVLQEISGFNQRFATRYTTFEDIAFLTEIFTRFPVYVSNECWDRYRRHSESLWSLAQTSGELESSREIYFSWLHDHLVSNGVNDSKIWALYRKRTWRYRHLAIMSLVRAGRRRARPLRQFIRKLFSSKPAATNDS